MFQTFIKKNKTFTFTISREVSSQKCDEVSGSKGGKRKFHDVWK
jgi:hypothetical protein